MSLNQWLRRSIVTLTLVVAVSGVLAGSSLGTDDSADVPDEPRSKPLTITITAAESGQASSLTVGLAKLFDGPLDGNRLKMLERRLKDVFGVEGKPFDQVVLRVDPRLRSGDLIKVINVCDRQKTADGAPVKKMSLVVLGED